MSIYPEESFFSKLNPIIQEKLYITFMKANSRDKILFFTKLKYGDDITFKELSEKMHSSNIRSIYTEYLKEVKSGVLVEMQN